MTRLVRWVCVCTIVTLLAACSSGSPSTHPPSSLGGTTEQHTVPTVLILDASGSMTTPDAPGPRIDAAKAAAKGLVAALADDARLGLMTYGTGTDSSDAAHDAGCKDVTPLIAVGPLDRNALNTKIDSLTPSGYTPISLALENASGLLPSDGGQQAIVLVSDGEDTCGRPPCDVAAQLHREHPGLAISTVGFRTDGPASEQLACIANTTGGLFVQAANAKQLAARLLATQDVQAAKTTLSSTGFAGINLGSAAGDIRKANNDFPYVAASGQVTVQWKDCDFTFTDGVLQSIAPHDGGRTIDGISSGSKVSDAIGFYGKPLAPVEKQDGHDWLTFLADEANGFAYRMSIDGYSSTGSEPVGTITRIILCHCMPHIGPPVVTFDGYGPIKIGMTQDEVVGAMGPAPVNHYYDCTVIGENAANALEVWINDKTGRVTKINTPAGAMTDHGVGDGSTPDQVKTAYAGSGYTIEEGNIGGQGMPAINVRNGAGQLISFGIADSGRAQSPDIGFPRGWEGCSR